MGIWPFEALMENCSLQAISQTIRGGQLTSRLVYRFKDGSIDDETAVFTQSGHFRLLHDHHLQKGPRFPKPSDLTINAKTGEVTVRYNDKGAEKVDSSHMDLPDDLSNGILLNLAKNLLPQTPETKISYLAATPKPKIVHLSFKPDGLENFRSAGQRAIACRFPELQKLSQTFVCIDGQFLRITAKAMG